MAISVGDGSIVLTTKVDTSGIKSGGVKIKGIIDTVSNSIKGLGTQLTQTAARSPEVKKLQKEFEKTNTTIEQTQKRINAIFQEMDKLQERAFKSPDTQEPILVGEDKKQFEKLNAELDKLEPKLAQAKSRALELGDAISIAAKKNNPAIASMTAGMQKFSKRIATLVKRVFIFSVILKALRSLLNILKNITAGDDEFVQSLNELKVALWTAFTPLINVLIPAIKTIIPWITQAAKVMGQFFATMSGKSYNAIIEQARNFQKLSKGAKDAKKQLAGFDDIQILNSDKSQETSNMDVIFDSMKTEQGDHIPNVSEQLSSIIAGVGLLIAAIGLVLIFKTKLPLAHSIGLGMLIAGAGIFAVGAVQMMANNMGGEIGAMLHGIIAIASAFLLAIGLIMLFSGNISPVSIGLVLAGAVGLASEVALYPDKIKESLQGTLGWILLAVGGALLALGIILVCCGIITPLTIGMIVTGAAGVVTVVAVNWNAIINKIKDIFTDFGGIIAGAGIALIVLGIILCCTGVGVGIGIGLIVAGAAGLAGAVAVNWNAIVDWVKGAWEAVKQFWNTYIAPVFTAEFWLDLAKKCGNGLIGGFEAAINGIITMFEKMINWIVDGINSIGFDIPAWLGGGHFGFNIPRVSFDRVSIPRLAQGAVIPPNREFLAVLGDQKHGMNIEAPLQTIVDAFNMALAQNGGRGNTEVILEVDGREFGRAVVEQGNRENRRVGTRLVIG